jgi:hypothetical protein
MTALTLGWFYQPFTRAINTGSSPEAKKIEAHLREVVFHFRRRAERDRAFSELERIVRLGRDPNWDGYDAVAIDPTLSQLACRFLNALPSVFPTPEVGLDPDGEISFSWIVSRERQLHVSLSSLAVLSYAGLFGGTARAHGQEDFDDSIPDPIIHAIHRLGI